MSDLDELFDRDPLGFSKLDLEKIVTRLREYRENYMKGDKTAGKTKPSKSVSLTKKLEPVAQLNLEDLGL